MRDCDTCFAQPWVLWENDDEAKCPTDAQHYLDYRSSFQQSENVRPVNISITSEQLNAEWSAQIGDYDETLPAKEYAIDVTLQLAPLLPYSCMP